MCAKSQYCAYSHVSAMLDRTGLDWLLYMYDFEIYWDDSGTHKESPIAVAACYVATKEQWDLAVREWSEVQAVEGFGAFHMADFMAHPSVGKKPFCDWDQRKRDRVYYRLASIINTRVRMGFALAVPKKHFDTYLLSTLMKDEQGKEHFTFAVKSVLGWVAEWHERYGLGKSVQYVFSLMSKGKGEIMQIFDLLKEHPEIAQRLGFKYRDPDGLMFQNMESFKPLQAADILAWNTYNFMQREIRRGLPDNFAPLHPYFDKLWTDGPRMRIAFFREGHLRDAAADMRAYEEREGRPGYILSRRQQRARDKASRDF